MNETTSMVQGPAAQQPAPSKYLWTADGWIRGIRRPTSIGEQGAAIGGEAGAAFLRQKQSYEA